MRKIHKEDAIRSITSARQGALWICIAVNQPISHVKYTKWAWAYPLRYLSCRIFRPFHATCPCMRYWDGFKTLNLTDMCDTKPNTEPGETPSILSTTPAIWVTALFKHTMSLACKTQTLDLPKTMLRSWLASQDQFLAIHLDHTVHPVAKEICLSVQAKKPTIKNGQTNGSSI